MLELFNSLCINMKKDKLAFACAIYLALITLLSIVIPIISPYNYYSHDPDNIFLQPFTKGHLFGTDDFGRDIFVRVWEGSRISLMIGIMAALFQTAIGVLYGATAGIAGGIIDEIMMRIIDVVNSVPNIVIVVLITVVMGRNEFTIIFALSILGWTSMARVIRAQTFLLKEMEFVKAAKVLGAGKKHIIIRHIIPNCMGPVLVNLMFSIPGAIFAESFLSFLGLGIELPKASCGTLAYEGYKYIGTYPWLILIPLVFIGVTMISFNILGDAARDALDSKI